MSYETILTEIKGNVGLITLNRPKALNALNSRVMTELVAALQQFEADEAVGAMVITGSVKAFAAGADIKEMRDKTAVDMLKGSFVDAWDSIMQISKPIIAATSGWVLGGGCELALLCDMIVAGETTKFGQPEINLGIIPGAGGTQRLTRAVGKALAMEIILNDRKLSAKEALAFGLVNCVVSVEHYLDEALALAQSIAERAPVAVRLGKEAVNQAFETGLTQGAYVERRLFHLTFATEDRTEGMSAFIEKRPAQWRGK